MDFFFETNQKFDFGVQVCDLRENVVLGGDGQFGQKSENIVLSLTESFWGSLPSACEHKSDTYNCNFWEMV
jgi:hypothetical protein